MSFRSTLFLTWVCLSTLTIGSAQADVLLNSQKAQKNENAETLFFGDSLIRISYSKSDWAGLDHYDDLYNASSWYPSLGVEKNFISLSSYLSLGGELRFSYYTDTGSTGKKSPGDPQPSSSDVLTQDNGSLSLVIVPYNLLVHLNISPSISKYATFDAWFGYEELYFQEQRVSKNNQSEQAITNTGWHSGFVTGFSANILLDHLDVMSVGSLKRSLNIEHVFVAPYVEVVSATKNNMYISGKKASVAEFNRTNMGITFVFETM